MQLLVVSDFHLGRGKFLEDGEVNTLEDFDEDERFSEFLDYYSSGTNYFSDVHLILNGDIFNLIQLDVEGVYTHFQTEESIIGMVKDIIEGHPIFFKALKKFLSRPNKKISYIIGNHDLGMCFPGAQDLFRETLAGEVDFLDQFFESGVWIEHGQRFEPLNTVPRSKQIIDGPDNTKILNLPWASLFCIYLLPKLKEERPFLDKVRPLNVYVKSLILHDFTFFIKLCFKIFVYITRTQFPPYGKYNKNFKLGIKEILKLSIYPKYDKFAQRILDARKDVKLVIMGHTHIAEWRNFKDGRLYMNSGTWNQVYSTDAALNKTINNLHYVYIDINEKKQEIKNASLNTWKGKWRPFHEDVTLHVR